MKSDKQYKNKMRNSERDFFKKNETEILEMKNITLKWRIQ